MTGKEKKIKNERAVKLGSVSLIGAAIVLAVVILVNVAVNVLPSRFTKYNLSQNGVYDISDATKALVSGVKDKVSIYVVSETSAVDKVTLEYAKRLADLNSNIVCEQIDPNIKPLFVGNYTDETLDSSETSIIVANQSNGRSKVVTQSEIYYRMYTDQEVMMYYYYYGQEVDNPTYFDAENCLATAIDYVTTDKLPTVYYTSGHGETAIDATFSKLLEAENIVLKQITTLSSAMVPDDADVVIVNSPTYDFTENETATLSAYVDGGGKVILITNLGDALSSIDLPNIYAFTRSLGLDYGYSLVCEGSASYYEQTQPLVYAQVAENEYTTGLQSNVRIIMPGAHEIIISDEAIDGVTVSEMLTTSVQGYAKDLTTFAEKSDSKDPYKKEDGDKEGKITIGAVASKGDGSLLWFSSDMMLNGNYASRYANVAYMMSVITKLSGKTTVATASAKALQVEALNVSEGSSNTWGIILIGVVPLILLAAGIIIWYRRKVR
ncbi:MAG: Gldg family protein [Clostridia bacterium]|nr:Gldg family protein [Clostridia bacterium]